MTTTLDGVTWLARRIPPRLRERLKQAAGFSGHNAGYAHVFRAARDASGRKRLDRMAAEYAPLLQSVGRPIRGSACLSFGAGHLLNEAVMFWLAGAREVVAVDYFPILSWRFSRVACAWSDPDALVKALAPFDDVTAIGKRLATLTALRRWNADTLEPLGLRYVAPVDFAAGTPWKGTFDLALSFSVLEHLPPSSAEAIVSSVQSSLVSGGRALHTIHLEDHRDFMTAPHAFLEAGTDWTPEHADARGNRLRASDWDRIFASVPGTRVVSRSATVRPDIALPSPPLAPGFTHYAPEDLAVGGMTIVAERGAGGSA